MTRLVTFTEETLNEKLHFLCCELSPNSVARRVRGTISIQTDLLVTGNVIVVRS